MLTNTTAWHPSLPRAKFGLRETICGASTGAVHRFESAFCALALVFASALVMPGWASAGPSQQSLLLGLNSTPLSVTNPDEGEAEVRITGDSGKFSFLRSPAQHETFFRPHWVRRDTSGYVALDLRLQHNPDGSSIQVATGKRHAKGMPGVLAAISPYVRSFIIEYDLDEVISEVSLETYRGTVIYCGRIPDTHYKSSCSLGHAVLHGGETIRFHALIVSDKRSERDALLQEFVALLESLELHEP
jgi:hypothetical protein